MNKISKTAKTRLQKNQGMAALFTIIIIGVGALILARSASFLGLGEMEMGYDIGKAGNVQALADGCLEEALLRIARDNFYQVNNLSFPAGEGICTITVGGGSTVKDISSSANIGDITANIQASAAITDGVVNISDWNRN